MVESARECIDYENLEWVIVDNASIEPGLREYIDSLDFVQIKVLREKRSPSTEFAEAMNCIVERSSGNYLMVLSDDVQFIVKGGWMRDLIACAETYPHSGTIVFDAQRRQTLANYFSRKGSWRERLAGAKKWHQYGLPSGAEFLGYGKQKPGIAGAGIITFARKSLWEQLGPWLAMSRQTVGDATSGGETEMLGRYDKLGLKLERFLAKIPVAAGIITDSRGTLARIRGNRRYGKYFPPPQGKFYYRIWDESELDRFSVIRPAVAFEDIVEPIGFALPYDSNGNLLKNPHTREDDEFEWIHPNVAGIDLR